MDEVIELAIESPDGVIDCRIEPQMVANERFYNVTILYPNIVNGYSRSDIYCHAMRPDGETDSYFFDMLEEIHPKIKKLEVQLSQAIRQHNSKN
jgi:hypothetical protein